LPTRWLERSRRAACALVLALIACSGRVPDVASFDPILVSDGQVVELLSEADHLADRDPHAAARNLRETVLPRARANRDAVGRIVVQHPRARELLRELVRVTDERAATVEAYANALESGDVQALHDVIARQAALDDSMLRLERGVQDAKHAPPERGCGG
jgi:hypothetical protein